MSDVKMDLNNYSKLIKEGGYIIGDDYICFEGVKKAADEFGIANNKRVFTEDNNFWIKF